jgi:cyclomaltodextrinase
VIILNLHAIWHQSHSEYSYHFNDKIVHILLRVATNDIKSATILYGDPFHWVRDGKNKKHHWDMKKSVMELKYSDELFDYFFIELEAPSKRIRYAFLIEDTHNDEIIYHSKGFTEIFQPLLFTDLSCFFNLPYLHTEDLNNTPSWVKDTIWYQIFPDRFCNYNNPSEYDWNNTDVKNNEIYGGNLKGIIEKLPYIKSLGCNGLYLTPIFQANTAHKYDTVDYYQIDPSFGTNDDFKELVIKAHQLGIKIMLDGVFNHAGFYHPFFRDVSKNGKNSKYADAFVIKKWPAVNFEYDDDKIFALISDDINYETFATTPYMPKWNFTSKITEDYLLGVVKYWISEYKIDGWRLDVSNEISFEFLRKIKKVARAANPDTYILGENWDQALPWLRGDQMDGVMNYFLTNIIWDYIDLKIDNLEFKNRLTHYLIGTPKNIINHQFNLISSHDTIRIKSRVNGDMRRVKIAHILLLLSHGTPSIYYGDEIGLDGKQDPNNRRPMIWDETKWDLNLQTFIKKLIQIRKTYHDYNSEMQVIPHHDLLVLKTSDLTIIINNSNEEKPINSEEEYLDVLNNKMIDFGKIKTVKPFEFYIVKKE